MNEPVLVLEPPYAALREPDGQPPSLGSILVGDFTGDEPAALATAAEVLRLHAEASWCPVCLVLGPAIKDGPVLEALDPLDGSVAWIVRTAGGFQPDPATVVEAVQARPAPDAAQLSEYFRRRGGPSLDGDGEQLAERIARRLAAPGERVGWEWMAETAVREAGKPMGG